MAFRFPLQSVLNVRRSAERQQELLLIAANHRFQRLARMLRDVDRRIEGVRLQQREELQSGVTSAELDFERLCESALRERRRALEAECSRAERLRDQQQLAYQQARQRRDILETLHTSELQKYMREEKRREQRALDDYFLLARAHRSKG